MHADEERAQKNARNKREHPPFQMIPGCSSNTEPHSGQPEQLVLAPEAEQE